MSQANDSKQMAKEPMPEMRTTRRQRVRLAAEQHLMAKEAKRAANRSTQTDVPTRAVSNQPKEEVEEEKEKEKTKGETKGEKEEKEKH